MKLSTEEKEWLRLDAKILRLEREVRGLKQQRMMMKGGILGRFGLKGARDELLTAMIERSKYGTPKQV